MSRAVFNGLIAMAFFRAALLIAADNSPADLKKPGVEANTVGLWAAVQTGDVPQIRVLAAAGANLNIHNKDGVTPLMRAAEVKAFGVLRELLRLGADPTLQDSAGRTALTYVALREDGRAPALLLRAYAFMKTYGRPAVHHPKRPNLVMLFEPLVNYLHPRIKAAYYVNSAELTGLPGIDDDHNGFIDDVYGWNLDSNHAHEINPLQLQIYLQSRDNIARLFTAYNQHQAGVMSDSDYNAFKKGYDNPLAKIFGRDSGFTNGKFLESAIDLSHGTHVAGIVLDHSRETALLHTLSWISFGDGVDLSKHRPTEDLLNGARDVAAFIGAYRGEILKESLAVGRRMSDYLRATGAGIVNLSMGSDLPKFAQRAEALAAAYVRANGLQLHGDDVDAMEDLVRDLAFECYVADAVQFLVPMFENPDVLFVVAAGNEGDNNDDDFHSPAYLSRFLPNVITVAAVDEDNDLADFSNFGVLSVDLGAPGVHIKSTAIPESPVLMDGSSMSAPAVAGAAAFVRSRRPDLTAWEVKKLIQYTTKSIPSLKEKVATGGVLDDTVLFKIAGSPTERAAVWATASMAAASANKDAFPERMADADQFSRMALEISPQSADAWCARATYFDRNGLASDALQAIDRAVALSPDSWRSWMTRARLYANHNNHKESLASWSKAVTESAGDHSAEPPVRALLLLGRAQEYQAAGLSPLAIMDLRSARQLDPKVSIPDSLRGLLR